MSLHSDFSKLQPFSVPEALELRQLTALGSPAQVSSRQELGVLVVPQLADSISLMQLEAFAASRAQVTLANSSHLASK